MFFVYTCSNALNFLDDIKALGFCYYFNVHVIENIEKNAAICLMFYS